MTATTETHSFKAETRQLLDLMIHSLYSHKEIFLRELVSNSSDALDKLRVEALSDEGLRDVAGEPRIRLEVDSDAGTLTIDDNGIGMGRDEVVENIGTIARSGTREFAAKLADADGDKKADLIGQFGVGFYSAFMVADEVVLETKRAGGDEAVRWSSRGDGEYTLDTCDKDSVGTRVTLHLRPQGEDEDGFQDFSAEHVLRQVVKTYSDFVEFPIQLDVEREEGEAEEKKTVVETQTLNSMRPLWTRAASDVTAEEHNEFYRHLSHDWSEPLQTIHFRAEGAHEYTALLYIPQKRGMDVLDPTAAKSRINLHVKRVFVTADCEDLVAPWLRFIRGVVDSNDMPLNISRETLQHARQMGQIRKRVVKKVLDAFGKLLKDRRDDYVTFWNQFGSVIKEGLYVDDEHREALAKVCLFSTSAGDELVTLSEYVDRAPMGQEEILYVTGSDRNALLFSPHLEAAKAKGHEVLLLTDPVDDWVVQRLSEFEGKPLKALDKGETEIEESDDEKKSREDKQGEIKHILNAAQSKLDEHVSEVRLSSRLSDSPAVLVGAEGAMSPHLEEMLRASGQEVPKTKRILELNPDHAVLTRMTSLFESGGAAFEDFCELVHGQALLAEGGVPADAARFAKLLGTFMGGGEADKK